jgi:predicted PolB exonuclease-like 3'-5' exonuclease
MEALKHYLFIDIETVSATDDFEVMPAGLQEEWIRKTRVKWGIEADAPECFREKAAIFSEFGKVVCISIGCLTEKEGAWTLHVRSFASDDEKELLERFCASVHKFAQHHTPTFVGHNIKEFDLPYLSRRMIINGMRLPECLRLHGKKPWEVPHVDTMQLWAFGDYKSYTRLALLAEVLGIPSPKDDISGEDVSRVYWQERDLPRIVRYCQKDVETTVRVFMRLMVYEELPFKTAIIEDAVAA